MASLSNDHTPASAQSPALLNPSFNPNAPQQMDVLPSPNAACFQNSLLQEFEGHLPLGKFQQELAQAWQPPNAGLGTHLLSSADKSMKSPMNSFGFADGRLLPVFNMEAVGNLQNFRASPELTAGNSMSGGNWEVQKLAYSSAMASMLSASNSALGSPMSMTGHGAPEGASVRELVGRLGSNICGKGVSPLASSSPTMSEMEKLLNLGSSNWTSVNPAGNLGLTVDPSKGSLAIQGINLPASQCLANFSTDPGFAERAAKFSCFSSQNYSELAQPFPLTDGGKSYPRSAPRASDKPAVNKLTRMPSGHYPSRCSTPNSPTGATGTAGLQDPNGVTENFSVKATQEPAGGTEDLKCLEKRSGRTSCSPSRIEGSEGTQKHCTSANESDEADGSLGQEESSSSERGACETASQALIDNPGKKRKIGPRDRSKEASRVTTPMEPKDCDMDEAKGKRYKSGDYAKEEEQKPKVEQSNSGNSGDSTPKSVKESSKPPEAPKPDYIHVRARRGQATDSHSLAERVRREKISERMKFLQDLVPGCSKVTGKAVMLDEIINYVQSLQRQVEFLSMKLAAVNPRLDFSIDSFFGKEMIQPRAVPPSLLFAPENTNSYPPLHQQSQGPLQVGASCPVDVHSLGGPTDSALRRSVGTPLPSMDAYGDSVSQQISQAWDDELQSIVQMGFTQGRPTPLSSQSLQGRLFPGHLKVEL